MSENFIYAKLPVECLENASGLGLRTTGSSGNEFVLSFCDRRSAQNDKKEEDALYKPYYLAVIKKKSQKKASKLVESIRKKRGTLTVKEKKLLKINDIRSEKNLTYLAFIPLHQLWLQYFRETIMSICEKVPANTPDYSLVHSKLLKSDFHGCIMSVTKSKCPFLVGLTGIIIQETRNVFKIITKEDTVKIIPKTNTVFVFEVDGHTFTIYGNQFRVKPSERAVRKFKSKATLSL